MRLVCVGDQVVLSDGRVGKVVRRASHPRYQGTPERPEIDFSMYEVEFPRKFIGPSRKWIRGAWIEGIIEP